MLGSSTILTKSKPPTTVRKVTSRGGGAALPLRPRLFQTLVAAAVAGAGAVPVSVKMRIGLAAEPESMRYFLEVKIKIRLSWPAAESRYTRLAAHASTARARVSS